MLNIKNILSAIEIKANAKLPIGEKQMEDIIKSFKSTMNKALDDLWNRSASVITTSNVSQSIAQNSITFNIGQEISKVIENWREDMLKPYMATVAMTGGKQTSKIVSDIIDSITQFDFTDINISNYINSESMSLVIDMTNTQMSALRETLKISMQNGYNQAVTKQLLKQNVSLTLKETQSVLNKADRAYNKYLKESLERGMSPKAAKQRAWRAWDKERGRAYRKAVNVRTARIHRTETTRLKNFADIESLKQAKLSGKINQATKTWRRTAYNDNWQSSKTPSEGGNDGVTVGVNEVFPTGDSYPSEINERCILEYRINYNKVRI